MKRLKATKGGRETLPRGTSSFPCAGYYTNIEEHVTGDIPWHWHEEVEFFVVIGGSCKITSGSRNSIYFLKENDGAFINSDILHTIEIVGNAGCQLISFVFSPTLLSSDEKDKITAKYITPYIQCRALEIVPFHHENEEERRLIYGINNAFIAFVEKSYGYELHVRNALSILWTYIISENQTLIKEPSNRVSKEEDRVRAMIDFIEKNYEKPITPKEIAQSISVSERECFRCFSKVLGETPIGYLTQYRIQMGMDFLLHSNQAITEIAFACGFNSASYFTKIFRTQTGYSPREYRDLQKEYPKDPHPIFS